MYRLSLAFVFTLLITSNTVAYVDDIDGLSLNLYQTEGDQGTTVSVTPTPGANDDIAIFPTDATILEEDFTPMGIPFEPNRHDLLFSNDSGLSPRLFGNQDPFDVSMNVVLTVGSVTAGPQNRSKEAGFIIPFSSNDGQFTVQSTGEVAAFSGTLPFHSFGNNVYTPGTTINMRMIYTPPFVDGFGNPVIEGEDFVQGGTIEYIIDTGSGPVSSGPLEFPGTESGIIEGSNWGVYIQGQGEITNPSDFNQGVFSNFVVASDSADFDSDNDVDGADFLTWQRGFGLDHFATRSDGSADGDIDVDADDLAIWEAQFGPTPAVAAVNVVPEPTSFVLFTGSLAVGIFARRRR